MLKKFLLIILMVLPLESFSEEIEIGGLLIDNTISRQGREFSHQFSQFWRDIPSTSGFNVQIKEQVIPRSGTKLSVYLNNDVIVVTYMGRRQQPINNQVERAVFALLEAMAASQFTQNNPDLANDGW
ncbi:curli production assembly/transport protein CsgE [Psychrosphaera sp.]|nr:curli production assembly/transport protein CsgE [Psychrosphaera sp.]